MKPTRGSEHVTWRGRQMEADHMRRHSQLHNFVDMSVRMHALNDTYHPSGQSSEFKAYVHVRAPPHAALYVVITDPQHSHVQSDLQSDPMHKPCQGPAIFNASKPAARA